MLYANPIVNPWCGVGNLLFTWARAAVFCKRHGARMLAPQWAGWNVLRFIGPLRRGERFFRYYGGDFTNAGYTGGVRRRWINATGRHVAERAFTPEAVKPGRATVVDFDGMADFFTTLLPEQAYLKDCLHGIVSPRILAAVDKAAEEKFIGVHVRLGDFAHLGRSLDPNWYVTGIKAAAADPAAAGYTKIRVFTDGHPEQLEYLKRALPDEPIVVTPKAPAIQDILTLSRAAVVVGTTGSTFSSWPVFLGQQPSYWMKHEIYPVADMYPGVRRSHIV